MSAYPTWTPASRTGIVPLHPLTFGTILGRSFSALRHNPRVLLGFAVGVQAVAYLLLILGIGAAAFFSYARLDTVRPGSDEFDAILAGSTLITGLAGFVLGVLATALQVIVQAVVVVEVAHAVVAEKLTVSRAWRQVRPVFWRLFGYMMLILLVVLAVAAVITVSLVGIAVAGATAGAIALTVLVILGSIPLYLWLSTKLLLVPSAIILERATVAGAIARSWRLTRTRFWPILGIVVVVGLIFNLIGQVISVPFTLLGTGLSTIFAPTGETTAASIAGMIVPLVLTYVLTLLVQSIALIVMSTSSALIYLDCRMRHEGLDIDLLAYIDKRDAGEHPLPDPWTQHIGRVVPARPPVGYMPPGAYAPGPYAPGAYAPGPYNAAPPYPPQPYPQPPYPPQPSWQQPPGAPPYAQPAYQPAPPPPAPPLPEPTTPDPTRWTAPGGDDRAGREGPWS